MRPGDLLRGHNGRFTPVDSLGGDGAVATVYNLRIEAYHTYYVGDPAWGLSVWAHNAGGDCGQFVPEDFESVQGGEGATNPEAPAGGGGESPESAAAEAGQAPGNTFPENEGQIQHIFRDAEGHLPDTATNRSLLQGVADDPATTLGNDAYGNTWSARTNADGTQTWVQTRNGVIINGGVNQTPNTFNPQTGLSSPVKPGGK